MSIKFRHVQLLKWKVIARINADLRKRLFLVGPIASGRSRWQLIETSHQSENLRRAIARLNHLATAA